jgi:hypothetical protein
VAYKHVSVQESLGLLQRIVGTLSSWRKLAKFMGLYRLNYGRGMMYKKADDFAGTLVASPRTNDQ